MRPAVDRRGAFLRLLGTESHSEIRPAKRSLNSNDGDDFFKNPSEF